MARVLTIRGISLSLKGEWSEISAEMDAEANHCERKDKSRGTRAVKKVRKVQPELYKMVEAAVMDEKQEERA